MKCNLIQSFFKLNPTPTQQCDVIKVSFTFSINVSSSRVFVYNNSPNTYTEYKIIQPVPQEME